MAKIKKEISDKGFEMHLRNFVKKHLRRASIQWPYRNAALKKARVDRGLYRCALCQRADLKRGDFHLDHKYPVVATNSPEYSLDTFIRRLLVRTQGWQVLCIFCHDLKTNSEQNQRVKK